VRLPGYFAVLVYAYIFNTGGPLPATLNTGEPGTVLVARLLAGAHNYLVSAIVLLHVYSWFLYAGGLHSWHLLLRIGFAESALLTI